MTNLREGALKSRMPQVLNALKQPHENSFPVVDVEVNVSAGGQNGDFFIVGLPDTTVRESRKRVMAAIGNNGFGFPYQSIADVQKEGSGFDLPMAVGILGRTASW